MLNQVVKLLKWNILDNSQNLSFFDKVGRVDVFLRVSNSLMELVTCPEGSSGEMFTQVRYVTFMLFESFHYISDRNILFAPP